MAGAAHVCVCVCVPCVSVAMRSRNREYGGHHIGQSKLRVCVNVIAARLLAVCCISPALQTNLQRYTLLLYMPYFSPPFYLLSTFKLFQLCSDLICRFSLLRQLVD